VRHRPLRPRVNASTHQSHEFGIALCQGHGRLAMLRTPSCALSSAADQTEICMRRRDLILSASALGFAFAHHQPAQAQTGNVRVVVGFAPGGSVDALARMTAESIAAATGRVTVVENKAGAGGRLALDLVKAAAPDGDTLLVAPQGPMTLFPHVFKEKLSYNPGRDFSPITRLVTGDFALTIGPMVPAKDLAGFRAWLRTANEKATFASPGAGTLPHFVGVSVGQRLGTPMTHVPYQGSARSMIDLAGGNVAAAVSPVTEALELHKAGKVHIVATTGSTRSSFVPEVPTFKEMGIDLEVPVWFAVYGPPGMSTATVDRLRGVIDKAFATPDAEQRLSKLGLVAAPISPTDLEALRRRELAMWEPVVKASGFTPSQ
jgi:tripartite-type tricarboxylate transporter receptor subunit TctC